MSDVPIQNFSVPASTDQDVTMLIASTVSDDTLAGSAIYFRVYEQALGGVDPESEAVLEKSSNDSGIELVGESAPMSCVVHLARNDTVEMLRNYYYEVTLIDEVGDRDTVLCGIMTVTGTEFRSVTT